MSLEVYLEAAGERQQLFLFSLGGVGDTQAFSWLKAPAYFPWANASKLVCVVDGSVLLVLDVNSALPGEAA